MRMQFDARLRALEEALPKLSNSDACFAQSLIDQAASRGLSDKQWPWVSKLAARAAEPKKPAPTIKDFAGVVALLDKAAESLKHPRLLVHVAGRDLRLSIAGPRSREPGSVNVSSTERSFDDRQWFGRVTRDGRFEASRGLDEPTATAITATLRALAKDPAKVAALYGQKFGSCCFCSIELTDARSVKVGYGPICAEKWGLPWGER